MASPTNEPAQITAGDSAAWTISLPEYPPTAGWTLAYGLTGPGTFFFGATASGALHQVNVPPSATATWTPGKYLLTAMLSRGAGPTLERKTPYHVALLVLPNPALAGTPTHAARTLALIEAALENRIPRGLEETNIDGQMLGRISITDLYALKLKYKREVLAEQQAASAAAGVPRRKTIGVRFVG